MSFSVMAGCLGLKAIRVLCVCLRSSSGVWAAGCQAPALHYLVFLEQPGGTGVRQTLWSCQRCFQASAVVQFVVLLQGQAVLLAGRLLSNLTSSPGKTDRLTPLEMNTDLPLPLPRMAGLSFAEEECDGKYFQF